MDVFPSSNDGVGGPQSSPRGCVEHNGRTRNSQRRTSAADVRLLMKNTIITLSLMALMFGIRNNARSRQRTLFQLYSTLTLAALLGFFAWNLITNYDINILTAIRLNIWTVQGIGHFAIFYVVSYRYDGITKFLEMWQAYRDKYYIAPGSINLKSNTCATLIVITCTSSAVFDGYYALSIATQGDTAIGNLIAPVLNWLASLYRIFAWYAASCFVMLIVNLLADEYQLICKQVTEVSEQGPRRLNERIGDIRRRHWELSQVVGKADDILCAHVGLSFLGSLAASCIGLYLIIWDNTHEGNDSLEAIRVIRVVLSLTKLTSDCIAGIILNDAVSI